MTSTPTQSDAGIWGTKTPPPSGRYAEVNGLELYYETHGSGKPLILLHGGLGAGSMFGANLPALAANHQVIAVDLQGHGRTADIDRPIRIEHMADDVAALIEHLGLGPVDIMGYSLGGGVALQVGLRHPRLVNKLVLVSVAARNTAFHPEILAQQGMVNGSVAEMMKETPMYQLYSAIAPRVEDFPRLLDKIGDLMSRGFDLSQDIGKLEAPALIVAGDSDLFPPSHAVEVFALLGGGLKDPGWDGSGLPKSQLAILPGLTHYNIFADPSLAATALRFLDAP
jgi:pimeloyl-ACP methyl ester carboxylesterase